MTRQIHQLVSTITPGDAVGNTTLRTRDTLRKLGFKSEIFRWDCATSLEEDTLPARDYLKYSSPDSTVIFHYSIGSELNRMVWGLQDKLILCYHNITPPEFFLDIHNHVLGQLYHGRKQLQEFANRCALAVGDSEYNRKELEEMGFANTAVLPWLWILKILSRLQTRLSWMPFQTTERTSSLLAEQFPIRSWRI